MSALGHSVYRSEWQLELFPVYGWLLDWWWRLNVVDRQSPQEYLGLRQEDRLLQHLDLQELRQWLYIQQLYVLEVRIREVKYVVDDLLSSSSGSG